MVFVYYDDGDWLIEDESGLEEFATKEEALAFIKDRMSKNSRRKLSMYTVIEGKLLELETNGAVNGVIILN